MLNISPEYTSQIFHKNIKKIYINDVIIMRGVVNIVYFFQYLPSAYEVQWKVMCSVCFSVRW